MNRLEGVVSLRAAATAAANSSSAGDADDSKLSASGAGLLAYYKELAEAVRLRELESRSSAATAVAPASEEAGPEKVEKKEPEVESTEEEAAASNSIRSESK